MALIRKEKKIRKYLLILIGIFFILFGLISLTYKYVKELNLKKIEEKSIELYLEKENTQEEQEETIEQEDIKVEKKEEQVIIDYIGVIEIPKINLKKGIVSSDSKYNNVNKSIYTISNSTFPNEEEISHIILAGHSGNSYISYFRNLKKLKKDDLIYLYYNNQTYIYSVSKTYEVEKTGSIAVGIYAKDAMTLITCVDNSNKQLVIVAMIVE